MRFNEAVDVFNKHLRSFGRAQTTIYGYKSDLGRFRAFYERLHNLPWTTENTDFQDVLSFLEALQEQGLQAATRNRILNALRSFFNCLHMKRIIETNPVQGIPSVPEYRAERVFLTEDEAESLIDAIEEPVVKVAAITQYQTGLRVNELVYLCCKDVDVKSAFISVLWAKGRRSRVVPMTPDLIQILELYARRTHQNPDPFHRFFCLPSSGGLSDSTYNRKLNEAAIKAGLQKHVTSHTLRHTFGYRYIAHGGTVAELQKLMGHEDISTTSVYLHATINDTVKGISRLSKNREVELDVGE